MQGQSITYNLDRLGLYAVIGMGIVAVCVSAVAIAFRKDEKSLKAFVEIAKFGGALRILTVAFIILAAAFLTMADKIQGEAAAAIISGVAGYVLGGFQRSTDERPPG